MKKNLILVAVGFLIGALLVYVFFSLKQTAYLEISTDVLQEQETKVATLTQGLLSASRTSEVIVSDCGLTNRARFDELLSKLSSLSRTELTELKSLYGSCAYYFATTQSIKTNQLAREVEVYKDILRIQAPINATVSTKLETMPDWTRLLELASEYTQHQNSLVQVQARIVDLLLQGKSSTSAEVTAEVAAGQEIRENIVFLDTQIQELRQQLLGS